MASKNEGPLLTRGDDHDHEVTEKVIDVATQIAAAWIARGVANTDNIPAVSVVMAAQIIKESNRIVTEARASKPIGRW